MNETIGEWYKIEIWYIQFFKIQIQAPKSPKMPVVVPTRPADPKTTPKNLKPSTRMPTKAKTSTKAPKKIRETERKIRWRPEMFLRLRPTLHLQVKNILNNNLVLVFQFLSKQNRTKIKFSIPNSGDFLTNGMFIWNELVVPSKIAFFVRSFENRSFKFPNKPLGC